MSDNVTSDVPHVVRLKGFPKTLELIKRGRGYRSNPKHSGAVIDAERRGTVEATLRVTLPGVSFTTGETTIAKKEDFPDGGQRPLLLGWALAVQGAKPEQIIIEYEVGFAGDRTRNTATALVKLKYSVAPRVAAEAAPAKKKKAPAKKAGGTRRGSAASRSAPRKGARGSSKARKSSAGRAKRKSR